MSDAQGKETDRLIETVSIAPPRFSAKARFLGGGICILILVATWILQAELLGSPQPGEWNKPFLLSYFLHMGWILALPAALVIHGIGKRTAGLPDRLPWKQLLIYGSLLGPGMSIGAWCWYLSLQMTNIGVNTAVYNGSFLLVFLGSLLFLSEKVTFFKIQGILLCVFGLALLVLGSFMKSASSRNSPWGYLLLVASMIGYAALSVVFVKVVEPVSARFQRTPVLGLAGIGLAGLCSALILWILVLIFHYTGFEVFEWPYGRGLRNLLISASMDVFLNSALLVGSLLAGPSYMAVGSLLTIPVGFVVQIAVNGHAINAVQAVGVVLVLLGSLTFEIGQKVYHVLTKRSRFRNQFEEAEEQE